MASRPHCRRSVVGELRDALIRLGTASGLLIAVWYATEHPGTLKQCAPAKGPHANTVLIHCLSRSSSAVVWHWAAILGTGTLLGLAAGILLGLTIPTAKRSASTSSRWQGFRG